MFSEDSISPVTVKFAEPAHAGEMKKIQDPRNPDNEAQENLNGLIIMNINKKIKKSLTFTLQMQGTNGKYTITMLKSRYQSKGYHDKRKRKFLSLACKTKEVKNDV